MPVRQSSAQWTGDLPGGSGTMSVGSGAWEGAYSFGSRFEEGEGTNPEELIAAAHAGCFSMALSGNIGKAGFDPQNVSTTANVRLERGDAGFSIVAIELVTQARVGGGIDDATFQELAEQTKKTCPVSRALAAISEVTVTASLV
jgi:osmotically inducible protein OsmC